MKINWDWRIVNKAFRPLIGNRDRYVILYGGRGSSKSDYAAKQLIYNCMTQSHFRCIMIRKVGAKVKDSCYQNIKDLTVEMGIYHLFDFTSSPTPKIVYRKNGNYFMGAGLDDTTKIKSIKDPTCVWWEEDIPEEKDFITITTSIRTLKADILQEIFTINPEVKGDYRNNWFFKKFFEERYNQGEMSFSGEVLTKLDKKIISVPYTVHHSTHPDNPYLPDQFRAVLMELKNTNPYYYQVYTLGRWGTEIVEGRFYYSFTQGNHTYIGNDYNPDEALHISIDFNVRPYMSLSIWQIDGKKAKCIDEIAAKEPHNNTIGICRLFKRKYPHHTGGLFLYGDPAGYSADTRSERGKNDYTIIMSELEKYLPQRRIHTVAPSVTTRGNFINQIFSNNYEGIDIKINENCTNLINDMLFGQFDADGKKFKDRGKNKETGVSEEKYHHFSDGMDYMITKAFATEYSKFKRGNKEFDYTIPRDPLEVDFRR